MTRRSSHKYAQLRTEQFGDAAIKVLSGPSRARHRQSVPLWLRPDAADRDDESSKEAR
jgi:hypothetical protein